MTEPLAIEDALGLFTILKDDLTFAQEKEVALILLYLVAHPEMTDCQTILKDPFSQSYYYNNNRSYSYQGCGAGVPEGWPEETFEYCC